MGYSVCRSTAGSMARRAVTPYVWQAVNRLDADLSALSAQVANNTKALADLTSGAATAPTASAGTWSGSITYTRDDTGVGSDLTLGGAALKVNRERE